MTGFGESIRRLFKGGESGQAVIMALALLMLGSLIVSPGVQLAGSDLKFHGVIDKKAQEDYAADAGIYYAMTKLGNDAGAFSPEGLPAAVNDRTVTVGVEEVSVGLYRITSIATYNGENSTLVGYAIKNSGLFDYCIATTDGDLTITGNGRTESSEPDEGSVYVNGNFTVSGNGIVNGNAEATGYIHLFGNGRITGTQEEYVEPLTFAEIDTSVFLDEANQGSTIEGDFLIRNQQGYELGPAHITGSLTIDGNSTVILTGTVWVDGTFSIGSNARIEGGETLVAVSDIDLSGNAMLDIDNIPLIISDNGDIDLGGNTRLSMVIYAPNGNVDVVDNARVQGAVFGRSVVVDGNAIVIYETGLRQRSDLPGSGGLILLSLDRS